MNICLVMVLMLILNYGFAHADQCCSNCDKDKKTSESKAEPNNDVKKE